MNVHKWTCGNGKRRRRHFAFSFTIFHSDTHSETYDYDDDDRAFDEHYLLACARCLCIIVTTHIHGRAHVCARAILTIHLYIDDMCADDDELGCFLSFQCRTFVILSVNVFRFVRRSTGRCVCVVYYSVCLLLLLGFYFVPSVLCLARRVCSACIP